MCSSKKYPCPPHGRFNGNSKGEGVKKPNSLNENGISEGVRGRGGGQFKKPSTGGVWIFSGTTQSQSH